MALACDHRIALCLFKAVHENSVAAEAAYSSAAVVACEEPLVIADLSTGPPERNPIFYSHESYQGAEKRVYPYALQDQLTHTRADKTYTSLRLENPYVAISVMPDLGGRSSAPPTRRITTSSFTGST